MDYSPKLDSLRPSEALVTDGEFILAVHGLGFTMHSQVFYDGEGKATGMLGQDVLTAPFNPAHWQGEAAEILVSVKTGDHETPPLIFKLKRKETDNGADADTASQGNPEGTPKGSSEGNSPEDAEGATAEGTAA
jgi:hypothetical protein